MSESESKRASFVPPWALAALVPWLALGTYQGVRNNPGFAVSAFAGTLFAVLLIGVGVPYVAYRASKRSRRGATFTLLAIAVIGLAGQIVLLTRQSSALPPPPAASPTLTAFIRDTIGGAMPFPSSFETSLDDAIADAETKYSGSDLITIRAYHATMRAVWLHQGYFQQGIERLDRTGVFYFLDPNNTRDLTQSETAKLLKAGVGDVAEHARQIAEHTRNERDILVSNLIEQGVGRGRSERIADQMSFLHKERLLVAETAERLWNTYADLVESYREPDRTYTNGNGLTVSAADHRDDLRTMIMVASANYDNAIRAMDAAARRGPPG